MSEVEHSTPLGAGFAPDPWFDGVDARLPRENGGPREQELPVLSMLDEQVLAPSAPPAIVRIDADRGGRVMFDYPYPHTRTGRKRFRADIVLATGGVGHLLLRAVVQQCVGKSPNGWKVHLAAVARVAKEITATVGTCEDGGTLPSDILLAVERRLADREDGLNQAAAGSIRAAGRIVRRLPGTGHVILPDWRAGERSRDPTSEAEDDLDTPTDIEIEDLITLVMRKVLRTMAEDAQVRTILAGGPEEGPLDPGLARCAAFMREHLPAGPLPIGILRELYPEAAVEIEEIGYDEVRRAAYPTSADVVPFLVLLAFYTRLNPTVLCGLELQKIKRTSFLGQSFGIFGDDPAGRIEFDPYKPRQGQHQHVSFAITNEEDNPDAIVAFLRRWTEGVRTAAGPSSSRLFICVRRSPHLGVLDFVFAPDVLAKDMKMLCLEARVRPITPKQLRPAAVDLIFQASGGDMALVRASGWWRSVRTPEKVYLGPRSRRRGEEDLAFLRVLEERRRRFGIDVANRPAFMDRGAATPGWICHDPFSGPLRTKRGELCSAIGLCPICPNADLDTDSPESFAWLVALGLAILAKRERMPEEHWRAKWEAVLDAIAVDWKPLFLDSVIDEARALPPVSIEEF